MCGSTDNRHGIILAKNEEAKKYNVKTAETVWQSQKKCPELILLRPHHKEYKKYYKILNDIYANYTDRVEPFGIDESWLDMSGTWRLLGNTPNAVANRLREEVKNKTGLTISVGVSFNKTIAKLGSDYKKPNAVTEITGENFKEIVWPLSVDTLLFVGSKAKDTLRQLGIETIGQLAVADEALMKSVLGKAGTQLRLQALGVDDSPVAKIGESEQAKSIGNGQTFSRDLLGEKDVRTAVYTLADEVAARLRARNLYAATLQVLIKNPDFKTITRQRPLSYPTNLSRDLAKAGMQLVCENWDFTKKIRMITLTAQSVTDTPFLEQTSFLEEPPGQDPRREKLEKSIDSIREKYGQTAVVEALQINNDIGVDSKSDVKDKK